VGGLITGKNWKKRFQNKTADAAHVDQNGFFIYWLIINQIQNNESKRGACY